jgi:hypothetical protein
MSYIYELDVALLRMQYLLPANHTIYYVSAILKNLPPRDRSNLNIEYECSIICMANQPGEKCIEHLTGESLSDLVNQCRIWSILYVNEHSSVDNSINVIPNQPI